MIAHMHTGAGDWHARMSSWHAQMGGWMDHSWSGDWWLGLFGMVVFALLLAVVVLAVARLVLLPVVAATEPASAGDRVGDGDRALATLRERFATGEIDEEEFLTRRDVLEESVAEGRE